MKTKQYFSIATLWMIFAFSLGSLCLGQTYWKKTLGENGDCYVSVVQPTTDGNFLIVGYKQSAVGGWDGGLIKIKPNGDTLWTKTYGESTDNYFAAIQPTPDGNFLIAGYTWPNPFEVNGQRGWLLKIKPNGDTLWTKMYGDYQFEKIQPTTDGNFLIAGNSYGTGNLNGWLVKIKPNGDTLWTKMYGEPGNNEFSAMQPTSDGNFLIAGYTWPKPFEAGGQRGWLLKIKEDSDTLWTKTYGEAGNNEFFAIQPTPDGNFLIIGKISSNGWLLKIKSNGDALWTKTFGGTGSQGLSSIQPTTDDNFLIAGCLNGYDGMLIKIKPNGDTLWTKTFGGTGGLWLPAIQHTPDGNFLFAENNYIFCIIADQYAYKNTLFTYKIPVYSTDTLNFGYTPLKVPSGMTVSIGGTVSWTPKTDSVYMDHAEFLVFNDTGKKDTLTFNIFVNSNPSISVKPSRTNILNSKPFEIITTALSGKVKLSVPSFVKSVNIYDLSGRLVGKVASAIFGSEASAIWPSASSSSSAIPTGRYFAKASAGKNSAVKPFLLVR